LLIAAEFPHRDDFQDIIWNKKFPLEMSIFVWWLFMSHTATKDNIVSRKILQPHLNVLSLVAIICKQFIICFGGAIILEAFRLLFCHGWAFHLSDHVLHFNSLCSIVRRVRHFLHIIWLASI